MIFEKCDKCKSKLESDDLNIITLPEKLARRVDLETKEIIDGFPRIITLCDGCAIDVCNYIFGVSDEFIFMSG
ncbi:MAG: hypothetical protein WCE94_15705 [Candidatus Methanoperedens sp.]